MKNKWLDRTLINGPYLVLVVNERQYSDAMDHLKIKKSDRDPWLGKNANATAHVLMSKGKLCAVVSISVEKGRDPNSIVGLLVHEAVHVWQYFKEFIGEDMPSKEFEAYAIQNISQELIQAYSGLTAKKNGKK